MSDGPQSSRDEDAAVAQERELDAAEDLSEVGTEEETESAELEEETEVESEESESERIEERETAAMARRSKRRGSKPKAGPDRPHEEGP